jgi:hypothetical protein
MKVNGKFYEDVRWIWNLAKAVMDLKEDIGLVRWLNEGLIGYKIRYDVEKCGIWFVRMSCVGLECSMIMSLSMFCWMRCGDVVGLDAGNENMWYFG